MTESLNLLTRDLTLQKAKEKRLKDELTECQNTIASHQAVIKLIEENEHSTIEHQPVSGQTSTA